MNNKYQMMKKKQFFKVYVEPTTSKKFKKGSKEGAISAIG